MSLLRRALGAIVELPNSDAPPKVLTSGPTGPAPLTPAAITPPSLDATLQAMLMKAALQRKTVFSGMLDAAEALRNVPGMTDTQRMQAAAAMGNATGESVKQAVQSHISDLGVERNKFQREIDSARQTRVVQATQAADAHDASLSELQRQIDALQAQIASSTEAARQLRESANAAELELAQTVSSFDATFAAVEAYLVTTRDSVISALKK